MTDMLPVDFSYVQAVRRKYLQLGREIEGLPGGVDRDNLQHTHSKLGLFLGSALGVAWRAADTRVPDSARALEGDER